jgi:VCBS repeat-containing protein
MKRLLPVFAVLFFLAGCKKNVSELPPPTGTGADTFGASVNGKLWTPQKFGIMPSAEILEAHYIPDGVIINARNFASSPTESEFKFEIKGVNGPGVYNLNTESGSYAYYVERKITPTGEWKTNAQHTGTVTITTDDRTNKILAGTFQFQAASLYGDGPVTVTDGRFDVKVR